MKVVLISTYDLGHQPFGLSSPKAWLQEFGAEVSCLDLSLQSLDEQLITDADLVAFYLPMHTATRLAAVAVQKIKDLNPNAHLCFYGLYAPVNEVFLRELGADTIIGGEFEERLVETVKALSYKGNDPHKSNGLQQPQPQKAVISLAKQKFRIPDRAGLPQLNQYSNLILSNGERRTVGYTEATRGCKHLCRHCPIVPVYNGQFRIVQQEVVLADIRGQVESGAEHITFGDPDFFNGPGHAIPLVKALHQEWPNLTYDVTIKIEHLLKHAKLLPVLRDTGCLFITSAVESVEDNVLEILDKNHTRADFIEAVSLLRQFDLTLSPTFVTFTPWTSLEGYLDLLNLISELDLVQNVASIQYAIRLLIPAGSKLLELPHVRGLVGKFDKTALFYPWQHPDPRVDKLYEQVRDILENHQSCSSTRSSTFEKVLKYAQEANGIERNKDHELLMKLASGDVSAIPHMSEPWYCCAEPTDDQFATFAV